VYEYTISDVCDVPVRIFERPLGVPMHVPVGQLGSSPFFVDDMVGRCTTSLDWFGLIGDRFQNYLMSNFDIALHHVSSHSLDSQVSI
jgi:hypothetical protein